MVEMEVLLPKEDRDAALFTAGIMELGALVCVARTPRCESCPIAEHCAWRAHGYPGDDVPGAPKQKKYEGSDRQVRGLVLAELRASEVPVTHDELVGVWADAVQRERSIASLLADGLMVRRAGAFKLPS